MENQNCYDSEETVKELKEYGKAHSFEVRLFRNSFGHSKYVITRGFKFLVRRYGHDSSFFIFYSQDVKNAIDDYLHGLPDYLLLLPQ